MRIAIDVRSLMEGRHSGVEEYTTQIIHAMLRVVGSGRGGLPHQFHLFYNSARPVKLPDFGPAVTTHGFRYPNKIFNLSQWALSRPAWDKLLPGIDCVFMPNFRLMPLSPAVPLVTTVHDLSFEHFPELFSWRRRVWHRFMRPRLLAQNSDRLIAVSQHTANDLVQLYSIPRSKIDVVYSGISAPPGPPSAADISAVKIKYSLPDRFTLYFGTLEPRKNVPSIIEAFDAMASRIPHDLVIAGQRGWLTEQIDTAAARARHRHRIHFPGFIDVADKAALYAAADLFVYPSFYEGFGFPPLEALLAGTPVITSFNSALPEIVGQWATLINPYDVGELVLVMEELLGDLPAVSDQTRREIRETYSWDKAAKQTLNIIQQVV